MHTPEGVCDGELTKVSSFLFSVITAKMKKVRFNGLKILKKYQKSL